MEIQIFINDNGLCYSKNDLSRLPVDSQVKTAEAWIRSYSYPLKMINRYIDSYWMKHRAEEWGTLMREHFNTTIIEPYITNGSFIQAAKNLGYESYPTCYKSPNAYFRMGFKMPKAL